jgi:hypothetical protein
MVEMHKEGKGRHRNEGRTAKKEAKAWRGNRMGDGVDGCFWSSGWDFDTPGIIDLCSYDE